MRARDPDHEGFVERDGVRLYWEEFGAGDLTLVLLPCWSIVHSRIWKAQVPYLARYFRVVTFDGRGCGRSDRPDAAEAYHYSEFAADTVAVLDATGTPDAVLVGFSRGPLWGLKVAAESPERVRGLVCLGASIPLVPKHPERAAQLFGERLDTTEGWAKYNHHHWLEGGYLDFVEFFAGRLYTEPHSTKQLEDFIEWALEVEPSTLVATSEGLGAANPDDFSELCSRVRAPVLVIHGDEDAITPHATGPALAEAAGGRLVTIAGGGHCVQARHPVIVNHLIRRFVDRIAR
jgi:pimeloyl-ACP methyl ester carboxylesterase